MSDLKNARPLLRWGLVYSLVDALRRNLSDYANLQDIGEVRVTTDRPKDDAGYPAVIVRTGQLDVKPEGMAGYQVARTNARNLVGGYAGGTSGGSPEVAYLVYVMEGQISLEVTARSQEEAWSISDLITHLYLGRMLHSDSFFRTAAADIERVAIGMNPGRISWSEPTPLPPPWNPDATDPLYTTSGTFTFVSEHYVMFDLLRVSGIDIEAMPVIDTTSDGSGTPGDSPTYRTRLT